jgi:uncharacterized protein YwqG
MKFKQQLTKYLEDTMNQNNQNQDDQKNQQRGLGGGQQGGGQAEARSTDPAAGAEARSAWTARRTAESNCIL